MQQEIPQGTLQATWKPVSLEMQNKLVAWVRECNQHESIDTTVLQSLKQSADQHG